MSPEASKKTPRTFHCRESLWQKFEQMAQELECSVDYLINDAMKQYARQRGYTASASVAETAAPVSATAGALPPPGPPQPSRSASGSHSQSGSSAGIRPVQAQTRSVPAFPPQAAPAAPASMTKSVIQLDLVISLVPLTLIYLMRRRFRMPKPIRKISTTEATLWSIETPETKTRWPSVENS